MSQSSNNELTKSIIAIAAILGLVALIQVILLAMMSGGVGSNQMSDIEDPSMIAKRIKPEVTLADIRGGNEIKMVAAPVVAAKSAKELYNGACMACHNNGVAGAPKPGDQAAWKARYANGMDSLLASVVNGKGAMPAKGGSAYSDAEITKIIEYILIESNVIKATETKTEPTKIEPAKAEEAISTPAKQAEAKDDFDLAAGKNAYTSSCAACHNNGIAGAPKVGVAADWADRKGQGMQAMISHAINGKGAMPAKGGASHLSDTDIKNIVGYMLDQSK